MLPSLGMQLRTEIEIDAPPSLVWTILVDAERYHEWNPFITSLDGVVEAGNTLNVVVSPPDSSDFRFRPLVLIADAPVQIRWRGKLLSPLFFAGEHFFELLELPGQRTRLTHGEQFTGLLVRLLGKQLTATARGFVYMNQALKRRAESFAAARAG